MIKRAFTWITEFMHDILLATILVMAIVAIIGTPRADAAELLGADLKAWVGAENVSDDQDLIMLGVTMEWDHITFELGHGTRRMEWRTIGEDSWTIGEWQSGTNVSLLWHPLNTNSFVRPHFVWRHASDITRGRPFNDKHEPASDFLGVGLRFEEDGLPIEFDIEVGSLARECDFFKCFSGSRTTEIRAVLRVVFWE